MERASTSRLITTAALVALVATPAFRLHAQTVAKTSLVIAAVADAQAGGSKESR